MAGAAIGAVGSVLGGIFGGKGASEAAAAQADAIKKGIAQQQAQFDVTQRNVTPWIQGGQSALSAEMNLLGLGGMPGSSGAGALPSAQDQINWLSQNIPSSPTKTAIQKYLAANQGQSPDQILAGLQGILGGHPQKNAMFQNYLTAYATGPGSATTSGVDPATSQQHAIDALKASPLYTSLYNTGNDTILQDASATGGLRGGNAQNSLANFGSSLLAQVIQQQLSNLGGISGQGANAALGLGNISQNNANAQSQGYQQLGSANAIQAGAPYAALQGIVSQLTGGGAASLGNFFGGGSAKFNPANTYSNITAGYGAGG